MGKYAMIIASIQGLFVVACLAILQAVVAAFSPGFELPFSPWWGMIACIPGVVIGFLMEK